MQEPEGRPYDMLPVDFYTHIARMNEDYRSALMVKYYLWFKEYQLPAWQGNRERRKDEIHPRDGDVAESFEEHARGKYLFESGLWQRFTWEEMERLA
jgi:hypothetical protein